MSVTDRNVAMGVASILGISTPIYLPWGETEDYTAGNYESIISVTPEEEGLLSSLGTPVLGSFTLLGGTYDTYNSDGEIESIKLPDFCMPYATVDRKSVV